MLLDADLEFSDAQEETTVATHNSTNDVDLNDAKTSVGDELYFVIKVPTAVTSAGAATVQFKLLNDGDSAFGSATTVYDSGAVAKATLVAGYTVTAERLPRTLERYLRVQYIIGTADLTAGAFDAFLTNNIDNIVDVG